MSRAQPFKPRTVAGLVVFGIGGFLGILLLIGYGGALGEQQLRLGGPGGSRSAVGYEGLKRLVDATYGAWEIEDAGDLDAEALLIVPIDNRRSADELRTLRERRRGHATLFILPKWLTSELPRRRGWVRAVAPVSGQEAAEALDPKYRVTVGGAGTSGQSLPGEMFLYGTRLPAPAHAQTLRGPGVETLVRGPDGGALIARLDGEPHYLAADPDLFNNHGLRDLQSARAALALIGQLNATDEELVMFDLTADPAPADEGRSLIRTLFEPPFLVMTLALAAAALLAGLHGLFRFGPVAREERAIAFGKAALVENSAALIRLAGREAHLGAAYADVVRQEAARETSASQRLQGEELDAYLNRLTPPGRPSFSERAARLAMARDRQSLIAAARELFQWKKEIIR